MSRPRAAVIGAGVAGLTAAYILQRAFDVTLYEAQPRLGGHAHTHEVVAPEGERIIPIDSGFIVHNERTYPNLLRLFRELDIETQDSDMSMSVRCDGCGLEYAGARGLGGVLARAANATSPAFLRMLVDIKRFHRHAHRVLAETSGPERSLEVFVAEGQYSTFFVRHFLVPLVSCVWSCPAATALRYPARYLFEFLDHHGALSVSGSPTWRTVVGGSHRYVDQIAKSLTATARGVPVRRVRRTATGVEVHDDAGAPAEFERVVVATHADEALALLDAPTDEERRTLGAFGYSVNETVLHTDASLLPRAPRARASWNYYLGQCAERPDDVQVSYHMNRLHRLDESTDYVVTLNGTGRIDPDAVLARMVYTHPVYTETAVAAQRGLPALNDGKLAFAGAYHGWGFHEDGCLSGVRAAAALGVTW